MKQGKGCSRNGKAFRATVPRATLLIYVRMAVVSSSDTTAVA